MQHPCDAEWHVEQSPLRWPDSTAEDLGAASSAAVDIAEQTPEQLQPLLLPAVTLLPGLAEEVTP